MHGSPSAWLAVQYLLPIARGQLIPPHAVPVAQLTSQAHAFGQWTLLHAASVVQSIVQRPWSSLPQTTSPHALAPVQVMWQLGPSQVRSRHAESDVQVIVHTDPGSHVTSPHGAEPVHVISQLTPGGHVNRSPSVPPGILQTCGVTLTSQVAHSAGHAPGSTTQ
jgi:hypothetical protein